jgi:hypothetical protein
MLELSRACPLRKRKDLKKDKPCRALDYVITESGPELARWSSAMALADRSV